MWVSPCCRLPREGVLKDTGQGRVGGGSLDFQRGRRPGQVGGSGHLLPPPPGLPAPQAEEGCGPD